MAIGSLNLSVQQKHILFSFGEGGVFGFFVFVCFDFIFLFL